MSFDYVPETVDAIVTDSFDFSMDEVVAVA